MADSPITWFPRIRTLGTIDLDRNLRADNGTEAAPRAFSFFFLEVLLGEMGGTEALFVHPVRRTDQTVRTDMNAELTIFTQLSVDFDASRRQLTFSLSPIRKGRRPFQEPPPLPPQVSYFLKTQAVMDLDLRLKSL